MVKEGTYKVRDLLDTGILYNNAEVRVLNKNGAVIFGGMAWEMDDDILDLNLKHILSVYPTDEKDKGKVWIEVYDESPSFKPYMCIKYDAEECENCKLNKCSNWKQRRKSSHGGFVHEQVGVNFGATAWSPSTPDAVKNVFISQ